MELTIQELNEIIYALGVSEYKGMMVDKAVNASAGEKIREELDRLIKIANKPKRTTEETELSKEISQRTLETITPITDTGSEVADFLIAATAQLPVQEEEVPSTVKKAKFPGAKKSNLMDPEK